VSEPSQLYGRVRLSRAKFDELMASAFPDPSGDAGVLAWLEKAQYYGERYTPELIRERISSEPTVAEWAEQVAAPAPYGFTMPARNSYNETEQSWTLAVLDFSENYDDYLAAVAVFREAARFKDLPGEDMMLIYGHLFEDDHPSVALRIEQGSSAFVDPDDAGPLVEEANVAMEALIEEGQRLGGEEA